MLISLSIENEMSMPWTHGPRGAVPNDHARAADVDAVELRSLHGDAIEDRPADAVDGDSVLAPDDGHVSDLDVVVCDDDAAADHGARRALKHLAP
jgi:hypothetical protein